VRSEGTLVLLGPPGTGKTTALMEMISADLAAGVKASRIGFLSFSRNACEEIRDRIGVKVRDGDYPGRISMSRDFKHFRTIHSACFALLGLSKLDCFGRDHVADFNRATGLDLSAPAPEYGTAPASKMRQTATDALLSAYDWHRNTLTPFGQDNPQNAPIEAVNDFARIFDEWKTDLGLVDYTDMLKEVLDCSMVPPELDRLYVDEAQDLSPLQAAVVEWFMLNARSTVIAGDDDQAIYGFQGADPSWLMAMAEHNDCRVLGTSWRLPPEIHAKSQEMIMLNQHRAPKVFEPRPDSRGSYEHTGPAEALSELDDFASALILCRTRYYCTLYADELFKRGVPYLTREGKNPLQDNRRVRAIECMRRLLAGEKLAIKACPGDRGENLRAMVRGIGEGGVIGLEDIEALEALGAGLVDLDALRSCSGGWEALVAVCEVTGAQRVVEDLQRDRAAYYGKMLAEYSTVDHRKMVEMGMNPVRVETWHGSKGSQAELVIIDARLGRRVTVGYSTGGQAADEEERRCAYVAMTRARTRLLVTYTGRPRTYPFPAP
jgi:DNA helicase II / ATP-dependent DNA helicase PcrA